MKKILYLVCCSLLFINYSLADTLFEERRFILFVKLPIIPKISIMQISTNLSIIDNNKYELNFKVKALNLVDYISKINGEGFVNGSIKNGNYFPASYKYDYVRKSKKKSVSLKYLDGKISEDKFTPPFDKNKLTPIDDEQKNNTVDPATLFLRLLELDKTNQCNEIINVYDGKRRYDIIFNEKKVDSNVIECSAWQSRIGGYKTDKMDPLTNTDIVKIRYTNSTNNGFLELNAKKGLIELSIIEIH